MKKFSLVPKFKTFRARLSVPILISIFFFGSFATAAGSFYVYNVTIENERQNLLKITKSQADQVAIRLNNVAAVTSKIAVQPILQDYYHSGFNSTSLTKTIKQQFVNYSIGLDVKNIYLLDAKGDTVLSIDERLNGNNYAFRNYFKSSMAGEDYVESALGITTKDLGYYFSSPVIVDYHVVGVLVIKINLNYIDAFLKFDPTERNARMMFADHNGVILYSNDAERQYHSLGKMSATVSSELKTNRQYSDMLKGPLDYNELQEAIESSQTGSKIFDFYDDDDAKQEITALVRTGSRPFYIVYEISKDDFIFNTLKLALIVAGFVVIGASTALLVIYFIIDRSIRPLKLLEEATKKIGRGNFNVNVDVNTNDEFQKLADTMTNMASGLKESYTNLEDKVKEKTADLTKFQMAVAGTSDQVIIANPEGVIIFANKAASHVTGYSNEEILGQKMVTNSLWGGQMPPEFNLDFWNTLIVEKKPFIGIVENKKKSGKIYEAAVTISPILDEDDKIVYIIGIERDVTKEKEVDKAKTEFVSLASHQLRTPLSAINWYTEMLLAGDAGKITKEQKNYLDEIYKGNQRMVELVNSLLNVSRLDLGTFEINPKPMKLCEVIDDVAEEMEHTLKEKKQKFKNKCPDDVPDLMADAKLMRVIIQNLVSNAVKYTPESGEISVTVEYNKDKPNEAYVIKVKDSGYGIPKNQIDKIFTKLFRADNVRAMDTEGTGLGLYIIKAILDEAGGKICFDSIENKGTTFTITLPSEGMKQKSGNKTID